MRCRVAGFTVYPPSAPAGGRWRRQRGHTHTVATSTDVSLSCVGGDFCRIYQERSQGDETLGVDFSAIKSGVGGAGGVGAWSLS